MRVGSGFDLHRFKENRKLVLAGVEIPSERGLDGVSDADIILHSICDSILGALGKGDIGDMYPPEDPANQGLDSKDILSRVLKIMYMDNFFIENIDITIILEEVRLKKYKDEIIDSLADMLDIKTNRIGFKIKSQEKIIPYEKGCAMCLVSVLLNKTIVHNV